MTENTEEIENTKEKVFNAIVKMHGDPMSNDYMMVGKERIDSWGIIDNDTLEVKSIDGMSREKILEIYYA